MSHQYRNPPTDPSSIGPTVITQFHIKKSLTELAKETYFGQLADVVNMPKNYGKKISQYLYVPMLDDRNVNDQGIDANGVVIDNSRFTVYVPELVQTGYADAAAATAAAAAINAIDAGSAVATGTQVTFDKHAYINATSAQANTAVAAIPGSRRQQGAGNLYGSSKDIGTILGKLPVLGETGGRVNRVGQTRILREGVLLKMGMFQEMTQEAKDFDDDPSLAQHMSDEMLKGANELVEDILQIDLLTSAGVVLYPGSVTNDRGMTGEGSTPSVLEYTDLDRFATILSDNRTPKQTKIISGSRMVDTRTVGGGYIAFVGSEMLSILRRMKDLHGNPAWIPAHQYAAAGNLLVGEAGTVGDFRFVVVPEMLHYAGVGANVVTNPGYRATNGRYDVFPMLVVGSESFSAIGFQTSGSATKFRFITKLPGEATANHYDPYGETGFTSLKWYYGTLVTRPERIGVAKSVTRV